MPPRKINATKKDIVFVATKMFLEKGFTATSVKSISDELGISTGNLTFHYPTKEHLLALLVEMLCDFQWQILYNSISEESDPLEAWCTELPAITAIAEENPLALDFYKSAYMYPSTLEIIRRNDCEKAKRVFGDHLSHWTDENFAMAQVLSSGIEYGCLMNTSSSPVLAQRMESALHALLAIYSVEPERQNRVIQSALSVDYLSLGRQVLHDFTQYVSNLTEEQVEGYLNKRT